MKNYKELFSQLKQEQTDLALFTTIMSKIDKEKKISHNKNSIILLWSFGFYSSFYTMF